MILIIIAALAPERTPYCRNVNHRHGFRHAFSKRVCSQDAGSICVPPQKYIRYSYFEKGCRKKCTRQTRKVLWVVLSSLLFQRRAREAMDVCLRVLKESNKSRFDSYSVRNSVLIISHITFRDCRVHMFSDNLSRNSCILWSLSIQPKLSKKR